ncbi:MAG: hypothetical protein O8C67_17140 [Candidatus Methanoperedens sp.]|nr:hypothetical protein [Candidatus Methanoperedens sp.]MCZ7406636.1 hypothetical protein [Candidatus Methanoperedens sp.]
MAQPLLKKKQKVNKHISFNLELRRCFASVVPIVSRIEEVAKVNLEKSNISLLSAVM